MVKAQEANTQGDIRAAFVALGSITPSNSGDKLIDFLASAGEQHVNSYAAPINIVLYEDKDGHKLFRQRMAAWPTNAEDIGKIVADSVRGKELLAKLDELKKADTKDRLEIARMTRKWKYMVQTAVTARTLTAKIEEAEANGFLVGMRVNSPNVVVVRKDNVSDTKTFLASGLKNATFVGKSKLAEVVGQRAPRTPEPLTIANPSAAGKLAKALSGKISRWAEDPQAHKISDTVKAEFASLVTNLMELLAVPLDKSQEAVLARISEVSERVNGQ